MNKLLKSKKKDDGAAPSHLAAAPSKRFFGRKQKQEAPAVAPQINMDLSLPADNEFRTSLIMPNLSARFSMLRDQNNPNSLIGKASDDSVLSPKRRSRLGFADYSGSGLGDIAEIESIRDSFRPPFAPDSRTHSFQSLDVDDDSMNGSIMARARPGEGNVLFGGRQKIYKIPVGDAGAVANLGSNESRGMRGRALYEDDVHLSAFQRLKQQERLAERERKLAEMERESQEEATAKDSLNSPALSAYDEKRATSSSTNSGPSMVSTTATSVASQPTAIAPSPTLNSTPVGSLQRSNSRRLYDQNLDQHITDQQNEKLTRLSSLTRRGSNNGRPRLNQSRSATNMRERYDLGSNESSRAASPQVPASETLGTGDAARNARSADASPIGQFNFGFNTPTDNPLAQAVNKADRGKATALGQFNRPRQFNEEAFLERQRSLHKQRNNSRPRRPTGSQSPQQSDSIVTSPVPSGHTSAMGSRRPSGEGHQAGSSRPSVDQRGSGRPSVDQRGSGRPSVEQRPRAGTARGEAPFAPRMRAGTLQGSYESPQMQSPASTSPEKRFRSQSNASSQSPRKAPPQPLQPESYRQPTLPSLEPVHSNESRLSPIADEIPGKISFERGTEDDMPAPLQAASPPQATSPAPPLHDHPAMRIGSPERPSAEKRRGWSPEDLAGKFNYNGDALNSKQDIPAIDVDTSAADEPPSEGANGLNIGGFVRAHLRQISNVSSVYDGEESKDNIMYDHTRNASILFSPTTSGPFTDPEALEPLPQRPTLSMVSEVSTPRPESTAQPSQSPLEQPSHVGASEDITPHVETPSHAQDEKPHIEINPNNLKASDAAQWMAELEKKHTHQREISTETTHERRAFAEDLRQRQKTIQENLRIKNENNSRSGSPNLASSTKGNVFESSFKPFGLMRKPSTKDNVSRDSGKQKTGDRVSEGAASPSKAQPVGRTLHMRMTGGDDAFEITEPGVRPGSTATRSTDPDSGRPSTSPDESSTTRSSSVSGMSARAAEEDKNPSLDVHRREFPSSFPSTHPTARPSIDASRARAASASAPPMPPLPLTTSIPPVPTSTASGDATPNPQSAQSPMSSARGTPPLSTASSVSELRSGPVSSPMNGSQSGSRSASPAVPTGASFNFPVRTPSERPAALAGSGAFRRRSPSIKKSDISNPTLISSTSTFETVELAEKRAALKKGKVAAAAAEINATSAGETWATTNAAGQPPSVPPMSPMRRGFFQRRQPENTPSGLSQVTDGETGHGGMF